MYFLAHTAYAGDMLQDKRIGAVLLMAGDGVRFGKQMPKQFHALAGKPVYCYALDTLLAANIFDEIVLVSHPAWMDVGYNGTIVTSGGNTRQASTYHGLKAFQQAIDIVLIHDAVRPFITEQMIKENVTGAIAWGAVDTCIASADTLVFAPGGKHISSIPKRAEFLRGQTPQTFRMDWIMQAHEKAQASGVENVSDDCQLVLALGKPVHVVAGDERNIKITSEFDLIIAQSLIAKGQLV